jgi:hypothetical protein
VRLRVAAIRGEKLQRHVPAEGQIFGFIHDAHTAGSETLQDPVVGDLAAFDCWHFVAPMIRLTAALVELAWRLASAALRPIRIPR